MQGSSSSRQALTALIKERVLYCIHHHRSLDVASSMQQELALLTHLVTDTPTADAQAWQSQMLLLFQLLLPATGEAAFTDLHLVTDAGGRWFNDAMTTDGLQPCLPSSAVVASPLA